MCKPTLIIFSPVDRGTCLHGTIHGKDGKRIAGLVLIEQDLKRAANCLSLLNPNLDPAVHDVLWLSAISFYARCFVLGKGRGLMLEDNHLKTLPEHLKDFHDQIMNIRHNYTSHAGENTIEEVILSAVLNPDKNNQQVLDISYAVFREEGPSDEEFNFFQELISKVNLIVDGLYLKAKERLMQELGKKDINQLYASIIPPPVPLFESGFIPVPSLEAGGVHPKTRLPVKRKPRHVGC
jgi:hypothetical protein